MHFAYILRRKSFTCIIHADIFKCLHPHFLQILLKIYAGVWGHGFHDLCSPSPIETRHKITMQEDAENVQMCTHDGGRKQIAISHLSNSENLRTGTVHLQPKK